MKDCCGDGVDDGAHGSYDEVFSNRFARRVARRVQRRGLDPTRRRLVDFLATRGLEDASVLEIGGGIGEVHLELLRRGARRVTNLEISGSYEEEAARLLAESGLGDRVTRRRLDIATAPEEVSPADVVVLHRVVCCYPDYERLLAAAASHATRLLVFSHPPRSLISRGIVGSENLLRRLRRNDFRAFVHPPKAMRAVVESQGMVLRYQHVGRAWVVVGFERPVTSEAAA